MLLALLMLVAAQDAPAPAGEVRFGHLRHVQLLEPRDGLVRFATQVELGTAEGHWASSTDSAVCVYEGGPLPESERQVPVAELAVGTSMLRYFTWSNRPTWFLFELEGATRLAAVEPLRRLPGHEEEPGSLRILDFPGGEELLALAGVDELEDAFVRRGRGELLARRGGELAWLQIAETGEVAERRVLDPQLDCILAATLARGDERLELRGWCVGLRGEALTAVPFTTEGVEADAAFGIQLEGKDEDDRIVPRTSIRLAAMAQVDRTHLAVGWPDYDAGLGKVAVLDLSGEEPTELWEGRLDPEVESDIADQREFGQALAFVTDADEDGVPDLVVSGPCGFYEPSRVDLISGRTGAAIARWTPGHFTNPGHWLSVSADGARVLVGGTEFRSMPEDLAYDGHAHLLALPDMELLATWIFPLRR